MLGNALKQEGLHDVVSARQDDAVGDLYGIVNFTTECTDVYT